MRTTVTWTLAAALMLAPMAARADDWTGCLVGPTDDLLTHCVVTGAPAAVLAAVAAPVVAAGAVYTIVDELNRRHVELGDGDGRARPARQPPNLSLVPASYDRFRDDGSRRATRKPNPALQFNETAATVATVVTGAAVVGAIIASAVKK